MVDYSNIPRDSRRVPLATKVQFKFDRFSGFISEYSANISPTGMFIVSSSPEPAGRVLDLEFRLGDGFEIITGKGEVVWTRTVPDGAERPPGMGIRFTELSNGSKDLIYRIVDRYIQDGGTPFDLSSARDRSADLEAPAPAVAPGAPPAPALPPLELGPDPFPDLELDPVKDSSGNELPWFSGPQTPSATAADAAPALGGDEEKLSELFPSIGPALEEVEQTFAGQRPPGLERTAPGETRKPEPAAPPPPRPSPAPAQEPPPAPAPLLFPSALPAPARADRATEPPIDVFAPGASASPPPAAPLPSSSAAPSALPAEPALFAEYLPKTVPAREAPQVRTLASLAGSAAAQEPRRVAPWILLGLLVAAGGAAWLLRDRLPVWLGLAGGDEEIAQASPPRARPSRPQAPPAVQSAGLTSDTAAETPASSAPPPALPEVVQRKPTPAAAVSGRPLTAVERITYEQSLGGTDVVLWGDGAFGPDAFVRSSMGGPPRELFRLLGIRRPFSPERIKVNTDEVKQVRVGFHGGNELHVVIDLAAPGVKVTRVDQDGQRLRIHLQKG